MELHTPCFKEHTQSHTHIHRLLQIFTHSSEKCCTSDLTGQCEKHESQTELPGWGCQTLHWYLGLNTKIVFAIFVYSNNDEASCPNTICTVFLMFPSIIKSLQHWLCAVGHSALKAANNWSISSVTLRVFDDVYVLTKKISTNMWLKHVSTKHLWGNQWMWICFFLCHGTTTPGSWLQSLELPGLRYQHMFSSHICLSWAAGEGKRKRKMWAHLCCSFPLACPQTSCSSQRLLCLIW